METIKIKIFMGFFNHPQMVVLYGGWIPHYSCGFSNMSGPDNGWQQVQIARWTMGQLQVAKLEVIFFLRY
jgi:hypothetical protein